MAQTVISDKTGESLGKKTIWREKNLSVNTVISPVDDTEMNFPTSAWLNKHYRTLRMERSLIMSLIPSLAIYTQP